ncbi:hypothetical protein [Ralstonia solanacearum]|uniref:hypothetical protein n=1 Tax=Ralstonia solanacearum TaxID=305 RepID=UPI003511972B
MHYEQLRVLVPALGKSPDFQACLAAFPALAFAKTTPQDPRYHASAPVLGN